MKTMRVLLFLFTLSVLVSQSAMDFFSVVICGYWIWLVVKARSADKTGYSAPLKLMRPMGLEKLWVAWVAVAIIGFALNPMELGYAVTRVVEFKWIFIVYVLAEAFEFIKLDEKVEKYLMGIVGFVAFSNLFIFLTDFHFLDELRYGVGGLVRAGGFFSNPMTFSHSFVLFFCVLLGIAFTSFKKWSSQQQLVYSSVLAASALGLFFTYTRGVWIGLVVTVVTALLKVRLKLGLLLIVGLLVFGSIAYKFAPDMKGRVEQSVSEVSGFSERKLLWRAHFEIFKDHPLFGAGYGQNTQMLTQYYDLLGIPQGTIHSHAHNQFLHLAAATGILGLGCYLLMWFYFISQCFQLLKKSLSNWDKGLVFGFLLAQFAFLIAGLTEANFEHSKVRFSLMMIWACLIYLMRKYQTQQEICVFGKRIKL